VASHDPVPSRALVTVSISARPFRPRWTTLASVGTWRRPAGQ
jgi:hypothetical protein